MRTRPVVLNEYQTKNAEQKTLLAKGKDALTTDDVTKAEGLEVEIDGLAKELKSFKNADDLAVKQAQRDADMADVTRPALDNSAGSNKGAPGIDDEDDYEPSGGRRSRSAGGTGRIYQVSRGRVSPFRGTVKQAERKAHRFGMFFLAAVCGSDSAREFCGKNGIKLVKAQAEGNNGVGGYLVPDEFEDDMIVLREQYGVFRSLAKVSKMRGDSKQVPRRKGGLKAYFVGEGNGIEESKKGWDRVTLTARKLACLAIYSNELGEDAVIDIGNDMADEIAYAFAQMEDECGFNGDGTSQYGRITGARQTILDVDPNPANVKGLYTTAAGITTVTQLVLNDFSSTKKRLPKYARNNACWMVSQAIFDDTMERLALAAGGVTAAEVAAGLSDDRFMGKPVEICQALPDDPQPGEIIALFGDLRLAALFGDRRGMTLAMSEHVNFAEDEIAVRGTERFDINIHDVGDTTVAGPLVALRLAAA